MKFSVIIFETFLGFTTPPLRSEEPLIVQKNLFNECMNCIDFTRNPVDLNLNIYINIHRFSKGSLDS